VTLRHPLPSHGHPYRGGLVLGGLVLWSPVYHLQTDLARDPQSVLFGFPLARQVLCISFTLIYIFTLDFPWLDLSGVLSLSQ
jgi:hypothetical protein